MHRQGWPWSSTEGAEWLLCEAGDQKEGPGEKRSSQSAMDASHATLEEHLPARQSKLPQTRKGNI